MVLRSRASAVTGREALTAAPGGGAAVIAARHWRDVRPGDWPLAHFSPGEMASRGDGSLRLAVAAGERLDSLRRRLGKPLIVHSAYRDPAHNARVGGAPLSRHKAGDAFDIRAEGIRIPRKELLAAAVECGFTGLGLYRGFLHMDCRPQKARWTHGGRRVLELWT